ncbi:unnamed protein product [Discosporangium mesarthrocarpum]
MLKKTNRPVVSSMGQPFPCMTIYQGTFWLLKLLLSLRLDQVAKEYISMYGEMGKESNTMLFNERPADVHALIAQVKS